VLALAAALLAAPVDVAARAGAVATEHHLAADAGAAILEANGSAVDAALAAAAAICVVHPSSCGIGGGGFALVHTAAGVDAALDYRESAPRAATLDCYLRDGVPDPSRTRSGGLAVAVPGEVAGWCALHARFGRLPLARVLAPAVRLARDGFDVAEAPSLRKQIVEHTALLRGDPGLQAVFLAPDGGPAPRIVQADLARTLERIGRDCRTAFVAVAPRIAAAVQARGGVLDAADVRAYRPEWRTPLAGTYRGRRVLTFPPPGSGGVVLEMLGLVAEDDPARLPPATWAPLLARVMAQAFADRAAYYGDTRVPVRTLLDPGRLAALRARIARGEESPVVAFAPDAGTAHVSVVDADGDAVAITTTINTGFGAGIMVPGTGIVLNDEMDDFALPGTANVYGLTGSAANAIEPGKRPQSSMSPTIVLADGRPALVVGASGGSFIISAVAQTIVRVVAFGDDVPAAVAAPRLHDQATGTVVVEPGLPADARTALERIGRRVREFPGLGAVAAVGQTPDGHLVAGGDRRKDGGEAITR